ncbi:MAG: hypothetical protein KJ583_03470 [Nanoarchaeota archaeon]|nr:hypothetical protein [Nanoarchaeota archaeon]MBU1269762.1 hypothetical protein [Nanoarchaeota archaeon]MBU1604354.1 hypothetical protein [Nanoarchaeota archaeon]MBU2443390.1 hypothetical protein [Nanoarchaeota archaeon]
MSKRELQKEISDTVKQLNKEYLGGNLPAAKFIDVIKEMPPFVKVDKYYDLFLQQGDITKEQYNTLLLERTGFLFAYARRIGHPGLDWGP